MRKLGRILLALDHLVEEVEVILSLDQKRTKIDAILARHRRWRHALGLERRDAVVIALDGGITGICQMCRDEVPMADSADHLAKYHGLPKTTARSGR